MFVGNLCTVVNHSRHTGGEKDCVSTLCMRGLCGSCRGVRISCGDGDLV